MKRNIRIPLTIATLLICATIAMAEIKEGLWEITTSMEMPGMPVKMPAATMRTCISKNDMVPKPSAPKGQEQDCKMKDQNISGNTVSYSMECKGKDGSTTEMSGKMTYTGDTMEGTTTIKIGAPTPMEMSSKMTGKYVGPCTK